MRSAGLKPDLGLCVCLPACMRHIGAFVNLAGRIPMNYKIKHEKIIKTLSAISLDTFIERLSSLEHTLQTPVHEEQRTYIPREPNFQLPNVFLKALKNGKVEKLFAEHGSRERNRDKGWDYRIDALVDFLDEMQFEDNEDEAEDAAEEDILEVLIKARFGTLDSE